MVERETNASKAAEDPELGSKRRTDLADRSTPFIENCWYVAARSDEVTRIPLRRSFLEQDIVLYRAQDGKAIALQNRCAHRSYPLSALGTLNGDRLVCGYHGFEYNPDGVCALVPALDRRQPGIRIQAYATSEVGPFVWIWMGPPEEVDYSKLPAQPWFGDGWRWVSGYYFMEANYLGLHENLMDLTHFPFLHSFAKGQIALAQQRPEVEAGSGFVRTRMRMADFPMPPETRAICGMVGTLSEYTNQLVETPAMHVGSSTLTDSSCPPNQMQQKFLHFPTPATQTTTHYFWAVSRDVALDSDRLDELTRSISSVAFEEDKAALEEIERMYACDNRPAFRERLIAPDAGGVQVLRLIARMAKHEASGSPGRSRSGSDGTGPRPDIP